MGRSEAITEIIRLTTDGRCQPIPLFNREENLEVSVIDVACLEQQQPVVPPTP